MVKKQIQILLFLLLFLNGYAQKKKTVYINADSIIITKKEYKAANNNLFSKEKVTTDSLITNRLKSKRAYGFINAEYKKLLFSILDKLSNETTDRNSKIFIHNFSNLKKPLKKAKKNKCYWDYLNANQKKYTSFLITSLPSLKTKKNRTFYDEKKIIQQLFFSFSDYEINHVIIKPNGEFTIYYGDYNMCYILDSET